jgi:hypothetical protein
MTVSTFPTDILPFVSHSHLNILYHQQTNKNHHNTANSPGISDCVLQTYQARSNKDSQTIGLYNSL